VSAKSLSENRDNMKQACFSRGAAAKKTRESEDSWNHGQYRGFADLFGGGSVRASELRAYLARNKLTGSARSSNHSRNRQETSPYNFSCADPKPPPPGAEPLVVPVPCCGLALTLTVICNRIQSTIILDR
jgi:hypothetical protein